MLNTTHYQRNANQNYSEISPHTGQNGWSSKYLQTRNAGEVAGKGNPLALLVGMQVDTVLWRTVCRFLKKPGTKPGLWPSNSTNSEEIKTEKDTSNPMFVAVLFATPRTWKQPGCPLTDERIKQLCYIHTMDSAIKRNTYETVLIRGMNPEPIIQSEVSQKAKNNYHILTHIHGI